jgi:hypothetical protein
MAVTLSGEGRGNGKKPIWVWGALLGKGAKGMRDGMKFLCLIYSMLHRGTSKLFFKFNLIMSSPLKGLGQRIELKYLDKKEQFW